MTVWTALILALALGGAQEAEKPPGPETAECVVRFAVQGGRARNVRIDCGEHDGDAALRAEAERQMALFHSRGIRNGEIPYPVSLTFQRQADGGWGVRVVPILRVEPHYPPIAVARGHTATCSLATRVYDGRAHDVCVVCNATGVERQFETRSVRWLRRWVFTRTQAPERIETQITYSLDPGPPLPEAPPHPACPEAG
ncbi:MAG: hypothetical protein KIS81_08150 [Maricaulaceae bacterium]|nr:hypothetical protein [Maricaulaceae bacterium]